MAAFNAVEVNRKLQEFFANGVAEAGLEVGTDPGLPQNEYIQIPQSMRKGAAFRLDLDGYKEAAATMRGWNQDMVNSLSETTAARRQIALAIDDLDTLVIDGYDAALGHAHYGTIPGWVIGERIYVTDESQFIYLAGHEVVVESVHVAPPSLNDVRRFVEANRGHIRDLELTADQQRWVHAVRFWGVVAGLVTTSKSSEYAVVADPDLDNAGADTDGIVSFIIDYSANAFTAHAARAVNWRKSNHATGGSIATGFMLRWLNKMGYTPENPDRVARARQMRQVTDAAYIATHAISVHAVLAHMAGADEDHWALINPEFGYIEEFEPGRSVSLRMEPKTQVAGVAVVVDAVVTLRIAIKEGIAPLIGAIDQLDALLAAYEAVTVHGVRVASYAKWFLDGHPYAGHTPVAFDQKDAAHAELAGELAVIATRYYAGSTISRSSALMNAADQMGDEDAKVKWAALSAQRRSMSAAQLVAAVRRLKGASSVAAVERILSTDGTTIVEGVTAYNAALASIANRTIAVSGAVAFPAFDAQTVVANSAATPAQAEAVAEPQAAA